MSSLLAWLWQWIQQPLAASAVGSDRARNTCAPIRGSMGVVRPRATSLGITERRACIAAASRALHQSRQALVRCAARACLSADGSMGTNTDGLEQWGSLPPEITLAIIEHIDPPSMLALARSSRGMARIMHERHGSQLDLALWCSAWGVGGCDAGQGVRQVRQRIADLDSNGGQSGAPYVSRCRDFAPTACTVSLSPADHTIVALASEHAVARSEVAAIYWIVSSACVGGPVAFRRCSPQDPSARTETHTSATVKDVTGILAETTREDMLAHALAVNIIGRAAMPGRLRSFAACAVAWRETAATRSTAGPAMALLSLERVITVTVEAARAHAVSVGGVACGSGCRCRNVNELTFAPSAHTGQSWVSLWRALLDAARVESRRDSKDAHCKAEWMRALCNTSKALDAAGTGGADGLHVVLVELWRVHAAMNDSQLPLVSHGSCLLLALANWMGDLCRAGVTPRTLLVLLDIAFARLGGGARDATCPCGSPSSLTCTLTRFLVRLFVVVDEPCVLAWVLDVVDVQCVRRHEIWQRSFDRADGNALVCTGPTRMAFAMGIVTMVSDLDWHKVAAAVWHFGLSRVELSELRVMASRRTHRAWSNDGARMMAIFDEPRAALATLARIDERPPVPPNARLWQRERVVRP